MTDKQERFRFVTFTCAKCSERQTLAVPARRIMVACIACGNVQRPKE